MKIAERWINFYTPPHGLIFNSDGYAVPSPSVIFTVQASFWKNPSMVHTNSAHTPCHICMVQLPPSPNNTPIVPPLVHTTNDGMVFRQLLSRRNTNVSACDNSTLGGASRMIVMVNVCPINVCVYDTNFNCISWLLHQLFGTILHTVGHFCRRDSSNPDVFPSSAPTHTICFL